MGKFSGILLCSDFDGTLAVKGHVAEKNISAIRYFQENGGLFSIITGRTSDFLLRREEEVRCNTYAGCVNGTVIYDCPNRITVSESFIQGDLYTPLMQMREQLAVSKNFVIFHSDSELVIHDATDDFEKQLRDALSAPVLKVIIHSTRPYTAEELEHSRILLGDEFEQARSWETGLEIQSRGRNKGSAAKEIAELSHARRLICVGDYENDIPMLKAADISYSVGNAIPAVKVCSDRTTVSVEEGAIAAIIRDIENELKTR